MVLSAIGIFMVVDHHTFTALNLFGDVIPYNSFFMPMFVFISGYFNKVDSSTNLGTYLWKKVKNLLLPYTIITLIVFGLQFLMNLYKTGEATGHPSGYFLYILQRVITTGSPFNLVAPMWFVITLFTLLVLYALLKKLLGKIWNSYVMLAIFVALHLLAVWLAKNVLPGASEYFLLPVKCLFFLPFLELGIIYRNTLEKKHTALSGGWKAGLLLTLLLVNAIRTMILPNAYDIAFDSIDALEGFTSPYIVTPLISSVVGILFWLTFVDLVGKPVWESKFINYLSCNTFWIMGLHITFFNIVNCVLMGFSRVADVPYFNVDAFKDSEFYFWEISSNAKLIYLVVGLIGPLGLKLIYDIIVSSLGRVIRGKKAEEQK